MIVVQAVKNSQLKDDLLKDMSRNIDLLTYKLLSCIIFFVDVFLDGGVAQQARAYGSYP